MAYKRVVCSKSMRPNSTKKRKRKTNTKERVSKRKSTRKRASIKRKIARKPKLTSKNKRHIKRKVISWRKPVGIKSSKKKRKSSKKKNQRRTASVRKRIVKRKSPTSHAKKKVSIRESRRRKLEHKKSHKKQHVSVNMKSTSTQSNSSKTKSMNKKFVQKSHKKTIQSISNIIRRTQVESLKKKILSTRKFKRSKSRRIPHNEKASFQQNDSNRRPREELFEKNKRNFPLSQFQSNTISSGQLQSNKPLFKQLKTDQCGFEHLPRNEPNEHYKLRPVASNIPKWLQTELNESTSVEPMSPALTPTPPPKNAQSHYWEIQEVYYERDGESQLVYLNDIGLFYNFKAARDRFIQNYLEKIRKGCRSARRNEASYQWLYNAIEASRNSIYGYWLRFNDPKSGGFHETFLRKKQWPSLARKEVCVNKR